MSENGKLPYIPFYYGDFLAKTTHLDGIEKAAYVFCIMHLWQYEFANAMQLQRICKANFGQWRDPQEIWEGIKEFFKTNEEGLYYLTRVNKEREHAVQVGEKRRLAAKKSHEKRKQNAIANELQMQSNCNANAEQMPCNQNQNQNHIELDSLRSSNSVSETQAREVTPTPPQNFGQTPEQLADRNGPPTKERFLDYAKGNAGWTALGLTEADWEAIWLYGVGIEWRMPTGQPISDWKHWGLAQARKQKNNPQPAYRPAAKPAAQGFGATPYGSARTEILRQMEEFNAKQAATA